MFSITKRSFKQISDSQSLSINYVDYRYGDVDCSLISKDFKKVPK